jgi:hypothetical protein
MRFSKKGFSTFGKLRNYLREKDFMIHSECDFIRNGEQMTLVVSNIDYFLIVIQKSNNQYFIIHHEPTNLQKICLNELNQIHDLKGTSHDFNENDITHFALTIYYDDLKSLKELTKNELGKTP